MDHVTVPRLRMASWARVAAVAVAVLLVCWLVIARSTSAFSSETTNEDNLFGAGSVTLTDDDNGQAMFTVPAMTPGQTVEKCITVTYTGSLTVTAVKLYGTSSSSDLSPYVDLTIQQGGAGSTCLAPGTFTPIFSSGTLASFTGSHGSYATALGTGWTPASPSDTRAYKFTVTLQDDPEAQGKEARHTFTWEVRTTP